MLEAADETAVPAGRALAVDRVAFSARITEAIESHPRIEIRRELVTRVPDDPIAILATGPLTSDALGDLANGPTFCDNLVEVEPLDETR